MFGFLETQQARDLMNVIGTNLHALQAHVPIANLNIATGSLNQVINVGGAANNTFNGTTSNANGANYSTHLPGGIPTSKRHGQYNKYSNSKHGLRAIKHRQQRATLKIQAIAAQNRDYCPFNKLPIELRMKIFKYILPDVRIFEPTFKRNLSRDSGGGIQMHLRTVNSNSSGTVNGNTNSDNLLLSPATLPDVDGSPRYFVTSRPLHSFHGL
jgi:hypothetical protein